jgi:hypothetical protein
MFVVLGDASGLLYFFTADGNLLYEHDTGERRSGQYTRLTLLLTEGLMQSYLQAAAAAAAAQGAANAGRGQTANGVMGRCCRRSCASKVTKLTEMFLCQHPDCTCCAGSSITTCHLRHVVLG